MLRPDFALALLHYIIRLMSMTNPHVRLRVAAVYDRFPFIYAPLRTSEWDVQR